MNIVPVMGADSAPVTVEEVQRRVNEQYNTLFEIVEKPLATLRQRITNQEAELAKIYKPLRRRLTAEVKANRDDLIPIVNKLLNNVETRVNNTRNQIAAVTGIQTKDIGTFKAGVVETTTDGRPCSVGVVIYQMGDGTWTALGGSSWSNPEDAAKQSAATVYGLGGPVSTVCTKSTTTAGQGIAYCLVTSTTCGTPPPPPPPAETIEPTVSPTVVPTPSGTLQSGSDLTGCFRLVPCDATGQIPTYPPPPPAPTIEPTDTPTITPTETTTTIDSPSGTSSEAVDEWYLADGTICYTAETYVRVFRKVADWVTKLTDWLEKRLGDMVPPDPRPKTGIKIVDYILQWVIRMTNLPTKVFDINRSIILLAKELLGKYGGPLLGLYFTKGLISLIEKAPIGINFVIEANVWVDVELKQLKDIINYLIEYVYPVKVPDQRDVDGLLLSNEITVDHWRCLTQMNGYQPDLQRKQVHSDRSQPTVVDVIKYGQRYRHLYGQIPDRLRRQGWIDTADIDLMLANANQLPPPSDAIRFAIKDVFDPTKLGRAEMIQELSLQVGLREMFDAVGLSKTYVTDKAGRPLEIDPVLLYGLASYDEVSPTQAAEMNHRLRPDRVHRFAQYVPDVLPQQLLQIMPGSDVRLAPDGKGSIVIPKPVTLLDLAKLYKETDYNPIWRARLAAIQARVPGRQDVRYMYRFGILGNRLGTKGFAGKPDGTVVPLGPAEAELIELHMDMGNTRDDAIREAQVAAYQWEQQRLAPLRKRGQTKVCRMYHAGVLTKQEAENRVKEFLEYPEDADRVIADCDADLSLKMVGEQIRAIRRIYVKGVGSEQEVRKLLTQIDITEERQGYYIRLWDLQKLGNRKEIAAAQLCTYKELKLIDNAEMLTRLVRIGYPIEEARRIIKKCELGILARTEREKQRIEKAERREEERAAAKKERELRRVQSEAGKRMAAFLASRSEKHLKEWLRDRLITPAEVGATLSLKGWTDADITRWFAEVATSQAGGGGG